MIPIPISPINLVDTANRLGAIEAVKRKLVRQPDPAAAKLVTVLEELAKIYGAMEDELTTYLSIFLDDSDPRQLARERAALARLDGGSVRARMQEARGRCSKIGNIYQRYLTPWFDRVLNGAERDDLASLFRDLNEVDSQMVDAINEVAAWLEAKATETSDLADEGDFAAANATVLAARREARPLRQRIAEAMVLIRGLESEFIEVSGAV